MSYLNIAGAELGGGVRLPQRVAAAAMHAGVPRAWRHDVPSTPLAMPLPVRHSVVAPSICCTNTSVSPI